MKNDSFQRKVYEGIFLGPSTYFFLYFDVTPKKRNCNGTSKTQRQQKLLARWFATVLRIQLAGCNDNVV